MQVKEMHLYHGAALTQIIEHASFKAINRIGKKYGHYSINDRVRIMVKYRKGDEGVWTFTFTVEELRTIKKDINTQHIVFLCLVCGQTTICALDQNQVFALIDLDAKEQQSITVDIHEGGSIWPRGSLGRLTRSVPHNSFPSKIFIA